MKHQRKAITAREMEAAYNRCLERERDRERDWRETKQGAFESAALLLDFDAEETLERDRLISWFSDRGKGARQIRRSLLGTQEEFVGRVLEAVESGLPPPKPKPTRKLLIERARKAVRRHLPDCLTTFRLVIRNGKNRTESIRELMRTLPQNHEKERGNFGAAKALYFGQLKKILNFFAAQ